MSTQTRRSQRSSSRRPRVWTGSYARIRCADGTRRLERGAVCRVGRRRDNDLILKGMAVSRTHATICWDPESHALTIDDHGSANGTLVDGRRLRLASRTLRHGSVVQIGAHRLEVELSEECQLRQLFESA